VGPAKKGYMRAHKQAAIPRGRPTELQNNEERSGPSVTFDITTDIAGQKTRWQSKVTYRGNTLEGQYTAQLLAGAKLNLKLFGKGWENASDDCFALFTTLGK